MKPALQTCAAACTILALVATVYFGFRSLGSERMRALLVDVPPGVDAEELVFRDPAGAAWRVRHDGLLCVPVRLHGSHLVPTHEVSGRLFDDVLLDFSDDTRLASVRVR